MLGSCVNSPKATSGLRQAECYRGTPGKGGDSGGAFSIWILVIVFSFLSAIGYGVHASMAWKVHKHLQWKQEQGVEEVVDPEEQERRKKKAHDLWVKMTSIEGL